jgi:hypothetical protein
MSSKYTRRSFLSLGASTVAALLVGPSSAAEAAAGGPENAARRRTIDVSCNANSIRFVGPQGPNPNNPGDLGPHPYYGASFVVQGTIYPAATFASEGFDSGLMANGTAEFPDRVVGNWICRGWFVGDSDGDGFITPEDDDARGGIFTPEGKFVATTQIYDLDLEHPGAETLVSDGIELIDLNTPFRRAVTGGTGRFRGAEGQVVQTAVGVNATGLFNFEFVFKVSPGLPLH